MVPEIPCNPPLEIREEGQVWLVAAYDRGTHEATTFSTEETGIVLWPEDGDPVDGDVTDAAALFDAGTEPNAEPPGRGPDQAPAQEAPDQGADEGGVVRRLREVDDGHEYPAVGDVVQVTVTPT